MYQTHTLRRTSCDLSIKRLFCSFLEPHSYCGSELWNKLFLNRAFISQSSRVLVTRAIIATLLLSFQSIVQLCLGIMCPLRVFSSFFARHSQMDVFGLSLHLETCEYKRWIRNKSIRISHQSIK